MMSKQRNRDRFLNFFIEKKEYDVLVSEFFGTEYMSAPFSYQLTIHTKKASNLAIQGKFATVSISDSQGELRYFNGIVESISSSLKNLHQLPTYQITMISWLALLDKNRANRIFIDKTPREIIQTILNNYTFSDYDLSMLEGGNNSLEYFVQYQESDLNFITRLMAREGIFYYFKHEKNRHSLIIADQLTAYMQLNLNLTYHHATAGFSDIRQWQRIKKLENGKIKQSDYNFLTPNNPLTHQAGFNVLQNNIDYQFIYPGDYDNDKDGARLTNIRAKQISLQQNIVEMETCQQKLSTGGKFNVVKHDVATEQGGYLITKAFHYATDSSSLVSQSTKKNTENEKYYNKLHCINADNLFYPALTAKKKLISSTQTGKVIGPEGEEIYTDTYGRVKVEFNWLQAHAQQAAKSYWLRVSQHWAGNKWGMQFIPRIGHEVNISFENGDPSRPIIIGSVFNANNLPPYPLPEKQTQSGIKTRSTINGDSSQYNELRFDDLKDSEEISIHAQKNMKVVVLNNEEVNINNDQIIRIKKGNQLINVKNGAIKLDAEKLINFKVGKSLLTINKNEIKIIAGFININEN